MPTNVAFLPDGDFLLADGYGSWWVHRYTADGDWKSCFGGPGDGDETLNSAHGLWYDDRPGREPAVVVTDRGRGSCKYFSADGQYQSTLWEFIKPCNFSLRGDVMLVPDLQCRLTLLDVNNKPIVHLGHDEQWREAVHADKLRVKPDTWQAGRFVHPHDACFDRDGNILVAEWVEPGRVSKLTRLS